MTGVQTAANLMRQLRPVKKCGVAAAQRKYIAGLICADYCRERLGN